jgi:hypothetical protein
MLLYLQLDKVKISIGDVEVFSAARVIYAQREERLQAAKVTQAAVRVAAPKEAVVSATACAVQSYNNGRALSIAGRRTKDDRPPEYLTFHVSRFTPFVLRHSSSVALAFGLAWAHALFAP